MHVRECRSSTLVQQVRAQHFTNSSKGARRACTATEMDESLEDLLLETVEKQPLSRVSVTHCHCHSHSWPSGLFHSLFAAPLLQRREGWECQAPTSATWMPACHLSATSSPAETPLECGGKNGWATDAAARAKAYRLLELSRNAQQVPHSLGGRMPFCGFRLGSGVRHGRHRNFTSWKRQGHEAARLQRNGNGLSSPVYFHHPHLPKGNFVHRKSGWYFDPIRMEHSQRGCVPVVCRLASCNRALALHAFRRTVATGGLSSSLLAAI